jgi:hypothetical protein
MTHGNAKDVNKIAVVSIQPQPHLIAGSLSASDTAAVASWIDLNREVLLAHWLGWIDGAEMAVRTKRLPGRPTACCLASSSTRLSQLTAGTARRTMRRFFRQCADAGYCGWPDGDAAQPHHRTATRPGAPADGPWSDTSRSVSLTGGADSAALTKNPLNGCAGRGERTAYRCPALGLRRFCAIVDAARTDRESRTGQSTAVENHAAAATSIDQVNVS